MGFSLNQILNISRSGMIARLLDLDVTSNNLANVSTTGYKSNRSNFQELLDQYRYTGTQIVSTQRSNIQGAVTVSPNAWDIAIQGAGYFAIKLPDGRTAYTRDGHFNLDSNRQIVDSAGHPLVWQGTIPQNATEFHVNPDGTVMGLQGSTWSQIGVIQIYRFPNPNGLQSRGQNLLLESPVSGAAVAGAPDSANYGRLIGGALESSNVNVANEMAQLIEVQRSFTLQVRTLQQTDQMISQAIHMRS